ncbi:Crp/Fnr family transcriptional regulator [Rhodoferax sp.]|uniref:Crp/Fnr family transcriptional regulator n=1 Tax=Rhodoferax sp. TaxID=50421 RepID=UPI002766DFCE|nr:Crp/Fnr family transcriptional regulator [Rhodoferax sp.]
MATALNCALCQPPELERLVRSEPAVAAQWQTLPRKRLAPGDCLQAAGQPCTRSWLIEQGLVRCYYLGEAGTERNRSFHTEGAWVGGGMPPLANLSPYSIEALEPTQVVELSYATLQAWHQQFPQIQPLLNEAMSCLFANQSQREAELLSLSPQARYQAFLADQSALAERLPIHHVASYLGISHVSLSRIRARLGMANQGRLA